MSMTTDANLEASGHVATKRPHVTFSHRYLKLSPLTHINPTATFIGFIITRFEDISEEEKYFDTLYFENGKEMHYPLPEKGTCLRLFFRAQYFDTCEDFIFATIRSYNSEKERWYGSLTGKLFDVLIMEAKV